MWGNKKIKIEVNFRLHQPTIKSTGFMPINFLPLPAPPYSVKIDRTRKNKNCPHQLPIEFMRFLPINFLPLLAPPALLLNH